LIGKWGFDLNIKAKLQDAVNALNYGSISVQDKKEEETCSYRIKQTKVRKTIAINCRECDSGSSLNDMHCRKNILEILQKEVQADCLVLSRLYERDYEGEALSLLYTLAGFEGIITAYESAEKVPGACALPEKKACELERKEIIASFAKTVETDPLKARLEIKRFIQGKMLNKTLGKSLETFPVCNTCSKRFYHMLYEIEEKLSGFPEIPVIKKSEIRVLSKGPVENSKKGIGKTIEKTIGKMAGNLIKDTSGEVTLAEISRHFPFLAIANLNENQEKIKAPRTRFSTTKAVSSPMLGPLFPAPGSMQTRLRTPNFLSAMI